MLDKSPLRRFALGCVALGLLAGSVASPAGIVRAEGSRDLATQEAGDTTVGYRPFLEYRVNDGVTYTNPDALSAGIPRRTIIRVYAQAGEQLLLGSSANGIGAGAIRYRAPATAAGVPAPAALLCPTTTGIINTNVEESAGPRLTPGGSGYIPCAIAVTTSGVWEVEFISPNPGDRTNPKPMRIDQAWSRSDQTPTLPGTTRRLLPSWIIAWDVTVRGTGGQIIPGRAFTQYLSLNMGNNANTSVRSNTITPWPGPRGLGLRSQLYVQTVDGYRYRVKLNGIDPFGFVFFSNNKGFKDPATDEPIYRSVQLSGSNPNWQVPADVRLHNPQDADNDGTSNFTHKLFFDPIAVDMPQSALLPDGTTTWLLTRPREIPRPTDFRFIGSEGTPGQTGTGAPGTFKFRNPGTAPIRYTLFLDLNGNNNFGDANDRTLTGTAVAGENSVFWDGKDAIGAPVPVSSVPYNVRITFNAGEVHFPFIDAENNQSGFQLERLFPLAGGDGFTGDPTVNPFTMFYNDTRIAQDAFADGPGPSNPLSTGTNGQISAPTAGRTGGHLFGTDSGAGFGDGKGIDTWAYVPSPPFDFLGAIRIVAADVQVSKTHQPANVLAGNEIRYTITITNAGPSIVGCPDNATGCPPSITDANRAPVIDDVPAIIQNVQWTCALASGSGGCTQESGTGNAVRTLIDLSVGGVIEVTVTGTVPRDFRGSITNTVRVGRIIESDASRKMPADLPDPIESNNIASDIVNIQQPSAVTLVFFSGTATANGPRLRWQTGTEIDTKGFHVLRSATGRIEDAQRASPELIAARGDGTIYEWVDVALPVPGTYTYWLQETERSGQTSIAGSAVTVRVPATSATGRSLMLPLIVR